MVAAVVAVVADAAATEASSLYLTAGGSLSGHYEHAIVITCREPSLLTAA